MGTFGTTSVGTISQYVVGDSAATWHMLVADDYHLEAGGQEFRFALMTFFSVGSIVGHAKARHLSKKGRLFQKVDNRSCDFQFRLYGEL